LQDLIFHMVIIKVIFNLLKRFEKLWSKDQRKVWLFY